MSVETLAAGRYRIERSLGHGGMASVYLAHDEELDRPVAIKLLAENLAGDASFRKRFVREARVAAKLSHPNVVQVFDAGEDGERPFIVMEYIDGETLAETLARRGKLRPDEAVDLALQVCGGLEHAHDHGLVHRDVKPGNLLLRPDGLLKIADFGIARAAESTKLTQIGTVLGTAAYLSPEQASGEEVTAAADLYSLGAVLYELLTGRTPYEVESVPQLALQLREGAAIRPVRELEPGVPQPLEDAVMRALARNPAYRPDSAAELARELAASPETPTEPLPTRPRARTTAVAPARRTTTALRSREWLWVGVAAAVVLVALVIALVVTSGGSPRKSTPAGVHSPARGATPAEQARNFSRWLVEHSR